MCVPRRRVIGWLGSINMVSERLTRPLSTRDPGGSYVRSTLWRSPAPARRPEGFIEPCLPSLGHAVPTGPQWAYEIKHDGFRFICRRDRDRVRRSPTL
jgi:ATP-dependent DNA ligase